MPREKITLTLDTKRLHDLRELTGARSLSAAVDSAVHAYIARLRHLAAVDELLADLEREYGPVSPQTLEWAAKLVGDWEAGRGDRPGRG